MTHVLTGVDLALETQTILYLIFDKEIYLGFCLLGSHFKIMLHNVWYDPLEETDLRKELDSLLTHEKVLEKLAARISECKIAGDVLAQVAAADINTPAKLAKALSSLKLDSERNDEEDIMNLLSHARLPSTFKTCKPENIAWAVREMTLNDEAPFDDQIPIYIPLKGWSDIGSKRYMVLASFGPRSFSFRNARGDEIRVPKIGEIDPMREVDASNKLVRDALIVNEKIISECLIDFKTMTEKGAVRMDYGERAAGSRNHIFRGDSLTKIWEALKAAANGDKLKRKRADDDEAGRVSKSLKYGEHDLSMITFE